MEKRLQKKIVMQSKKRFHHEKFEITARQQPNEPRRPQDEDEGPRLAPTPLAVAAPPDAGEDEVPEEPPEEPVASNPQEEP